MATPGAEEALTFPPYPTKNKATPIDEDRWIELYHHLLLVAALQPSKPVIQLNHPGALQLLDAYTEGIITDDGPVEALPAAACPEGIAVFKRVCENLVPSIVGRIEELSEKNSQEELTGSSADRVAFPKPLWKFVITPKMISRYSQIRDRFDIDDEIEEPENDQELREFLMSIIAETYSNNDDDEEQATSRKKIEQKRKLAGPPSALQQEPKDERETFQRVGNAIQVIFKGKAPKSNLTYQQQDEIPDLRKTPENEEDEQGEFYILPSCKEAQIPRRSRQGLQWKYSKDSKDWYREDGERWRPSLVLRKFRRTTNEYTAIYDRTDLLPGLDPNDKTWYDRYNKMIRRKFRIDTGDVKQTKTNWSDAELAAMYREINAVISKDGLDAFTFKFDKDFIATVAVAVNAAGKKARQTASIDSRLRRPKGPIFEVLQRAQAMRARIDGGEKVPKDEQYPDEAVAIPGAEEAETNQEDQNKSGDEDDGSQEGDVNQDREEESDLSDIPSEELERIEHEDIEDAKRRSMNETNDVLEDASEGEISRSHDRGGKRKHSRADEHVEHKRSRTKAEDDAAQTEAIVRAMEPDTEAEEEELVDDAESFSD